MTDERASHPVIYEEREVECVDGPLIGHHYRTSAQRLEIYTSDGLAIYDLRHSVPPEIEDWFQSGLAHPWGDGPEPEPVYWLEFRALRRFR